MSRIAASLASILVGTGLVGCAEAPGEQGPAVQHAVATVLANTDARAALQAALLERGATSQLTGSQMREILAAAEVAIELDDVIDDVFVTAPDGLAASMFERAPLVGYVDHADTIDVTYMEVGAREVTVPLPEVPAETFVVVRPREITIEHPITAVKGEVAEATGGVYLRGLDLRGDWDVGSDEEIYTRCKEGNASWVRTNIESANDGYSMEWIWNEKIISIASPSATILCELKEEDTFSDDYMGSIAFGASDLDATSSTVCHWRWFGDGWAAISKHRGYSQCPNLAPLGMYCAQTCSN